MMKEEMQQIYPELVDAEMILDNKVFAKEAAERAGVSLEEIQEQAVKILKEIFK